MSEKYLKNSVFLSILKLILKIILFLILVVIVFIIGLFIGYSVIGDGNYWEVLNRDTWQHILDFIK